MVELLLKKEQDIDTPYGELPIGFSTGAAHPFSPEGQLERLKALAETTTPKRVPLEINLWTWKQVEELKTNTRFQALLIQHKQRGGKLIFHSPPPEKDQSHSHPTFDPTDPQTLNRFQSLKQLAMSFQVEYVVFHPYWFKKPEDLVTLWASSNSSQDKIAHSVTPAIEAADIRQLRWMTAEALKQFILLGARAHVDLGHLLSLLNVGAAPETVAKVFRELCQLNPIGFHVSDVVSDYQNGQAVQSGRHAPVSEISDPIKEKLLAYMLSTIRTKLPQAPITIESPVSPTKLNEIFGRNGSKEATTSSNATLEYWLIMAFYLSVAESNDLREETVRASHSIAILKKALKLADEILDFVPAGPDSLHKKIELLSQAREMMKRLTLVKLISEEYQNTISLIKILENFLQDFETNN
ncbi:MAG: hypothetical protein ACOZAN_02960 [Patescibacteria group bacterium]